MSNRTRIQTFYEAFVSAVYGFVLVIGFQQFVAIPGRHAAMQYILLAAAYLTVLYYWLIFVASTEDTFTLILSGVDRSDGTRVGWFWVELMFATAMIIPMLQLFAAVSDVVRFARAMLLVASLSLGWDMWAFMLEVVRQRGTSSRTSGRGVMLLLMRWIGLDLVFVITMFLLVRVLATAPDFNRILVASAILSITAGGAILNTIVIAPSLFLSGDTGAVDDRGSRVTEE